MLLRILNAAMLLIFAIILVLSLQVTAIPVDSINPYQSVPSALQPFLNASTHRRTTLFTILYPTNQTIGLSLQISNELFDMILKSSGKKGHVFDEEDLMRFINQTVSNSRRLRNGTLYEMPSNRTVQLAAQIQMEAIASSNYNDTTIVGNVTRQMFSWYLNDNLRHPLDYWTSLCDNYLQSIRQCMVRKPFQYYWWRTSVSFIYNACMNGLTALGGWRMEACVLATLSNNSDIRSIDCGRAMQCFRPKNTAAGANNDSTAITESENNSLFVPSFPGRQYQLYAERWVANLNQKQQALVMGQRAIFGTYIELFFGRLSKRNYWIYYASYTAIGVGIFVVFALIFPVYSLMLGVGGIVANVILLAGNHVFANLLLGYHEIKEQDAGYTLSPVVFEAS